MATQKIVTEYGRMWPREVFDILENKTLVIKALSALQQPGVYILYRDESPYYIGKTTKTLFSRLHSHSNISNDPYFNFWNYFSFFVVPQRNHVDEIEGILIASTPTANIALPRLHRVKLPNAVAKVLRGVRRRLVRVE